MLLLACGSSPPVDVHESRFAAIEAQLAIPDATDLHTILEIHRNWTATIISINSGVSNWDIEDDRVTTFVAGHPQLSTMWAGVLAGNIPAAAFEVWTLLYLWVEFAKYFEVE
jgi:hypothetical protein